MSIIKTHPVIQALNRIAKLSFRAIKDMSCLLIKKAVKLTRFRRILQSAKSFRFDLADAFLRHAEMFPNLFLRMICVHSDLNANPQNPFFARHQRRPNPCRRFGHMNRNTDRAGVIGNRPCDRLTKLHRSKISIVDKIEELKPAVFFEAFSCLGA